jgi:hypothetical protein
VRLQVCRSVVTLSSKAEFRDGWSLIRVEKMYFEGSINETQSRDARPQDTTAESPKTSHAPRTGSAEQQSCARPHEHLQMYTKNRIYSFDRTRMRDVRGTPELSE